MSKLLFAAVSLALSAGTSAAPLTSTQSVQLSTITSTVTDTTSGTSQSNAFSNQTVSFSQFASGTGVLTGVSSGLSFTGGTLTHTAHGTLKAGATSNIQHRSSGATYAHSTLGADYLLFAVSLNEPTSVQCTTLATCFPPGVTNLNTNATMTRTDSTWLAPTGTVAAGAMNNFVGAATVNTTLSVQNALIWNNGSVNILSGRATVAISNLAGSQSLTYSYLRHANASFSSASDTGSLTLAAGSAFSVFNFGDGSSAKLDSVGVQCVSGDCGAFNVTLPSFQDLAAGGSVAGATTLAAAAGGSYAATYNLVFSDDTAVGATGTHLQNSLLLTVQSGSSVPPIPEPGTWALMSLGLVGLAFLRRRSMTPHAQR